MARGSKKSYTKKQIRKAKHIEKGYESEGVSKTEAKERAWRTVNKQDGGAKKKRPSKKAAKRPAKKAAKRPAKKSAAHRNPKKRAAKKATRR